LGLSSFSRMDDDWNGDLYMASAETTIGRERSEMRQPADL